MKTPWGSSQHIETIAEGITLVSTASHGGFKVSPALNLKIPDWLKNCTHNKQGFDGWYEEDCDWCVPVLVYQNKFSAWACSKSNKGQGLIELAEKTLTEHLLGEVKIPVMGDSSEKKGLYLNLYHGRADLSEDLEGWGSEGPMIGPLARIKITYLNCISLIFKEELDALRYNLNRDLPELTTKEDCVEYQGIFYGDWSLEYHPLTDK